MLGIPVEQLGQIHHLQAELEEEYGPDLSCHCERCKFKKSNERRVSRVSFSPFA